MARLFIDGFEHGDLGLWDTHTDISLNSGGLITGAYSAYLTPDVFLEKNVTASHEVYMAFRAWSSTLASVTVQCYDASDKLQCTIEISKYGSASDTLCIDIHNSASAVEGTEVDRQFCSASGCYHVQIRFVNNSADNKNVQVKINNQQITDALFTNPTPDGVTTAKIRIYGHYSYVDDIIIDDANWPGAPFIYGLTPHGDGATTEWTPSAGAAHYPLVDEIPASSTDYVSSTTSGEVELYTFSNLPDTDYWSVNSVQVSAYAKTPGPPEDEYLQLGVRHAGANYFGAPVQLSTDFTQHATIFENNPLTGSAWTQDDVHSGEFGFKEVS